MQRSQDQRINLGELKGHIVKKIGVERSKKYFYYLSRFLCRKLAKREFDKSCLRLLGRENLSLHNHLIRSILRNATISKSPTTVQDLARPIQSRGDGSLVTINHNDHPVWSNRVLLVSPRKVRSGTRHRKMRDSPVESNGHMLLQHPVFREDKRDSSVPIEYGDLSRFDQVATAAVRDGENQVNDVSMSSPLVAPLGIPFCSASVGGGSRRAVPVSTVMRCYDSGGSVPDTEMVRKRMESIAVAHGLEGVSVECANTLNTMLDVYLKKLIKSCTDLSTWSQNGASDTTQQDHHHYVSMLDFRTTMELNPQQLGENWSALLERISLRSFEEQDLEVSKKILDMSVDVR